MKVESIEKGRTYDDGVVITKVLDKRYAKKDGTYNISIQVYHDRKYLYHRTKYSVHSIGDINTRMYDKIDREFAYVVENVKNLFEDDEFSLNALNKLLKAPKTNTFNDAMRNKIDELRKSEKYSTAGHYECALKKFEDYYGTEVSFDKINASMFEDLKNALDKKEKLSKATQMIYFSDYSTVLKRAIHCKLMKRNKFPFREDKEDIFKCEKPKGATKRKECYFDINEMSKIIDHYDNSSLLGKKWLSLFLFSYLAGGINLADMCRMKYDDNYFKSNGTKLVYVRKKTEEKNDEDIRIPLFDYMKELIRIANLAQKRTDEPKKGAYVFPFLNDKMTEFEKKKAIQTAGCYIGSQLKSVAKKLGIEKDNNPSMTFARHSFATNMEELEAPFTLIEYELGHKIKGPADNYRGAKSWEKLIKWNTKLLESHNIMVEAA